MMTRDAILITITVCSLASVPTRAAESFPLTYRVPKNLRKPSGAFLQGLAQRHADEMLRQLNLQISAVDRACDLSRQQREKLHLASLGAVQDSLDEWLAPIHLVFASGSRKERQLLLTHLGAPGDVWKEVLGEEEALILAEPEPPRGFFGLLFGGRPKQSNDHQLEDAAVLKHPIFTSTLNSVLTDQQRELLARVEQKKRDILAEAEEAERLRRAEAQAAHDAKRRQTRTERLVRQIGRRLALDDAQLELMTEAVEQVDVDHVVRWRTGNSGISSRDAAEFTLPHLQAETMRDILTPGQFAVWAEIVKPANEAAAGTAGAGE